MHVVLHALQAHLCLDTGFLPEGDSALSQLDPMMHERGEKKRKEEEREEDRERIEESVEKREMRKN